MQLKKLVCLTAVLFLILSTLLSTSTFHAKAYPAPTLTLSKESGKVGETISVNGTIDTENGPYQILFNGLQVANGTAIGKEVKAEFTVPSLPTGTYNVTLFDVNASLESPPAQFTIETAYILDVYEPEKPRQFLEGDNVTISITIKGGENNATYSLNMSVTFKDEVGYQLIELTTNNNGYASTNVTYPYGFEGAASTNYTGIYFVKLNENLAETSFTVGITELTEYHRGNIVKIHAVGYQPNENTTINIRFPDGNTEEFNVTADSSGTIDYENWKVPMNAPMGEYSIEIKNTKKYPDTQTFTVPGFTVNITTINLSGKIVSPVTLEILENETSLYNTTTTESGKTSVKLEIGNYAWKAIYNEKFVGEGTFKVSGEENLTLQILLSTLKIVVINEKTGKEVPFAKIKLSCNYTTVNDENKSLTFSKETDINGTVKFENVFVNVSYTIEGYKYSAVFSHITTRIPKQAVYTLNVIYPTKNLIVRVLDHANNPVQGLIVRAYEWTNGTVIPAYEGKSGQDGRVSLDLTFGWYRLRVFKSTNFGEILVNETKVELTSASETIEMDIKCKLLGLNVTIRVVDFFGSPLPNVKVKLELVPTNLLINETGYGEFFFEDMIGGNYRISVFLPGEETPYLMETVYLNKPGTVITLRDGDHVIFFGALIGTYVFATMIAIIIIVVVFAVLIAYRSLVRRWISKEKV